MHQNPIVIFVCEHGAAKSILAAAYFDQLASKLRFNLRAVARGTNPDPELSPQMLRGLSEDGLEPTESVPQKLSQADVESAQWIITFCELPDEYHPKANVDQWDGVPPVSENYERARDAILERLERLITKLG